MFRLLIPFIYVARSTVLGNDHNKPHSLMSDPISTMYFHNMFCDLLNKILFKPMSTSEFGSIILLNKESLHLISVDPI